MKSLHQIGILLIVFMSTSLLNAQNSDSITKQAQKEKSYITFNLFSPVDQIVPRWRIGYIKSINLKWKAGIELGYGNKKLAFADFDGENGDNYQLWEIRPELYYILDPLKKTQKYVSAELFYINHKDIYHSGGSYDQANYFRQKYGMHLKYGCFINTGRRFGLNIYTGLGFRIRNNNYFNILNPRTDQTNKDWNTSSYRVSPGVKFGFDFSLGLKLYFH
jgi:hypothetical protein